MSNDAVKEIQQSLNIIRSTTDKENYSAKLKVLELMTQAVLSHVKALDTTSLVKNVQKSKNRKRNFAAPFSKPLKSPSSKNNPNDTVPSIPQSNSHNVQDSQKVRGECMNSKGNQ